MEDVWYKVEYNGELTIYPRATSGLFVVFEHNIMKQISHFLRGKFHGELKYYNVFTGELEYHTYEIHGEEKHDFKKKPLSDHEKLALVLQYGSAPFLPDIPHIKLNEYHLYKHLFTKGTKMHEEDEDDNNNYESEEIEE